MFKMIESRFASSMGKSNQLMGATGGSSPMVTSPSQMAVHDGNTPGTEVNTSIIVQNANDHINTRRKSSASGEPVGMEDQFAAETPMKSLGGKSPYSHRFASFRRRSSARTNSFVSRAKATSFSVLRTLPKLPNDSGKNDVEELKKFISTQHESIIDLNKQVEIENKDGDEGPESQRASSSINSRLEDMGFLSQ